MKIDAVAFTRQIRDSIYKETKHMSIPEKLRYYKQKVAELRRRYRAIMSKLGK